MQLFKININFGFVKYLSVNFKSLESQLSYKQSQIHFRVFGSGSQPVICFHGYGENASYFQFLEKYAGKEYQFIAIDLPFHGPTKWNQDEDFSSSDLSIIVNSILAQTSYQAFIKVADQRKWIVLGFSLGGRVALSLYQALPQRISKLVLLAPDGLRVNGWYWLATQTYLGNRLFKWTMKHPGWFFGLLKILNRLGFVNVSVFKFVNHYIGDPVFRDLLYRRWTGLRRLRPDLNQIKKLIRERLTSVRLLYGSHDRIILPKRAEAFIAGNEALASLRIISSGHQVLQERHVADILLAIRE